VTSLLSFSASIFQILKSLFAVGKSACYPSSYERNLNVLLTSSTFPNIVLTEAYKIQLYTFMIPKVLISQPIESARQKLRQKFNIKAPAKRSRKPPKERRWPRQIPLLLSRSPHFACTYLFYFLIYVVSFVFWASWHQCFLSSRHLGNPAFFQIGLAYCSLTDHGHSFLSLTLHQLPIKSPGVLCPVPIPLSSSSHPHPLLPSSVLRPHQGPEYD